jgi:hypothetical protein
MQQQQLFDIMPGGATPPRSRTAGPETSLLAEQSIRQKLGSGQRLALEYVRRYPGRTARELDELHREATGKVRDRPIGKRLNELVRAGYITTSIPRACSVTGEFARTYWAAQPKAGGVNSGNATTN